jgi:hypothetical protein
MAGDVRIQIENDERMLASMENEVGVVMLSVARDPAEDTLIRL